MPSCSRESNAELDHSAANCRPLHIGRSASTARPRAARIRQAVRPGRKRQSSNKQERGRGRGGSDREQQLWWRATAGLGCAMEGSIPTDSRPVAGCNRRQHAHPSPFRDMGGEVEGGWGSAESARGSTASTREPAATDDVRSEPPQRAGCSCRDRVEIRHRAQLLQGASV
jgi:hypothetical protein